MTADRPSLLRVGARITASAAAVGAVTLAVAVFDNGVPVLSLGVLYLFAVLLVAVLWGMSYAVPVAVASMAVFSWFFLPPVHTLGLVESENWFALAVYVVTAVVVSDLAARARRRATEAERRENEDALLTDLSRGLLQGRSVAETLDSAAPALAQMLGCNHARIELAPDAPIGSDEVAHALVADEGPVGALVVDRPAAVMGREQFIAALGALLAVAIDRERLASEALETEALRRSDAIKTAILRSVSHDLRTPLTAIRVAADGLASQTLELTEDDRAALVEAVRSETDRLQRVVGDLLDLSRLQAGVAPPAPEIWTLDELLSQSLQALSRERERLTVSLPDAMVPVLVDAVQIERVIVNLLDNALKFSPPESTVRVRVVRGANEVVVRVTDDGPGMREQELERVFEPFHTAGGSERQGSGLGLAIARGFAHANGGRLWAESRPGDGATFVLALPAVTAPNAVPNAVPS